MNLPATTSHATTPATIPATTSHATIPATTSHATIPAGLQPNAQAVAQAVIQHFPQISIMYGVRNEPGSDHATGHAVDIMLPTPWSTTTNQQLGYQIRDWMQAHATQLGITYIIFQQHIWNIARNNEGWRLMPDRGGDTANHRDHVHVSVR